MMGSVAGYAAALAVFLALDAVWLNVVAKPLFARNLGDMLLETPRLGVAALFYALYVGGVVYLAVWPALQGGGLRQAVLHGALIGFLAYGTYEATNLATLRGWTWGMLVADLGWGTLLTALAAAAGYLAWRSAAG